MTFLISGCAKKPWKDRLEDEQYKGAYSLAEQILIENRGCEKGLRADLLLQYTTPVDTARLSGFLLYSPPTSYKFVVSNPLGQPVFLIAGNQKKYQYINTLEQMFIAGGMTSFALRNKLPIHFMQGRWYDWLTGKNTIPLERLTDLHTDGEERGIWMTFEDGSGAGNISHILVDPERHTIRVHLLETAKKKPLARIEYDDYMEIDGCRQPRTVSVSGLPYGTQITLELSRIEFFERPANYNLKPPRGYLQQYRP